MNRQFLLFLCLTVLLPATAQVYIPPQREEPVSLFRIIMSARRGFSTLSIKRNNAPYLMAATLLAAPEPGRRMSRMEYLGLLDEQGQWVTQPIYQVNSMDVYYNKAPIRPPSEGVLATRYKERWGYINPAGETILPFTFLRAESFSEGLAAVQREEDQIWGYIDHEGQYVIPPVYEQATSFTKGYARVKQDGRWGVIDKNGKYLIAPAFDGLKEFDGDYAQAHIDEKWGLIDMQGKWLHPPIWEEIIYTHNGYMVVKLGQEVFTRQLFGIVNPKGKIIRKEELFRLEETSEKGIYMAYRYEDRKYGLLRFDGTWLADLAYDRIEDMKFQGFYALRTFDKKYGLIDKNGKMILPCELEDIWKWEDNYFKIKRSPNAYGMTDLKGNLILDTLYTMINYIDDEIRVVKEKNMHHYGILGANGEWIAKPELDRLSAFSEGLAAASLNARLPQSGYINRRGEWIIAPQFHETDNFSEGLAIVKMDSLYGAINTAGEWVIPPQYDRMERFKYGRSKVRKDGLFGVIDPTGKYILELVYPNIDVHYGPDPVVMRASLPHGDLRIFDWNGNWIGRESGLFLAVSEKSSSTRLPQVQLQGVWGIIHSAHPSLFFKEYATTRLERRRTYFEEHDPVNIDLRMSADTIRTRSLQWFEDGKKEFLSCSVNGLGAARINGYDRKNQTILLSLKFGHYVLRVENEEEVKELEKNLKKTEISNVDFCILGDGDVFTDDVVISRFTLRNPATKKVYVWRLEDNAIYREDEIDKSRMIDRRWRVVGWERKLELKYLPDDLDEAVEIYI